MNDYLFTPEPPRRMHRRLRYSALLFVLPVCLACGDLVAHTLTLALLCALVIRHWCAYVSWGITLALSLATGAACALCASSLLLAPSAIGTLCFALGALLWCLEDRFDDWAVARLMQHALGCLCLIMTT